MNTQTAPLASIRTGLSALKCVLIGILLAVASVATSHAGGYKQVIGGVTVSYSGSAVAYFNPDDLTLTVEIYSHGGNLNITVGKSAPLAWGKYVDIYIEAADYSLKSINIKGRVGCSPYVCGQVGFVNKFALSYGVIGNTLYYGRDFGLGMTSDYIPANCR